MKILYFEGAGCEGTRYNDVENCRIRTAFTNDGGKKIYLEMWCGTENVYRTKSLRGNKELKNPVLERTYHSIVCDFCHYITGDPEDCNKNRLECERKRTYTEWTKENILQFVNKNCNCSFDKVIILPFLTEYSPHGEKHNTCNMMEDFVYDEEFTKRCEAKREEMQSYFKSFGINNTSYWVKDGKFWVKINTDAEKFKKQKYTERLFSVDV